MDEINYVGKSNISGSERVFSFDVLRVVAVYLTFVSHAYLFNRGIFAIGKWAFPFSAPAWLCMWVLYTMSGYLAGRRFAIKPNSENVASYYYTKMLKVWLPAIGFGLFACVFCYPEFLVTNPGALWKWLFLTYRGNPSADGISDLWFAFTVSALYVLAPFICLVVEKIDKKWLPFLCCVLLLLGLCFRIYAQNRSLDYLIYVYLPLYAQLDFFCSGIVASYYVAYKKASLKCKFSFLQVRDIKIAVTLLMACLFFFGFLAVWLAEAHGRIYVYTHIYSYIGPTIAAIVTLLFWGYLMYLQLKGA